MWIQSFSHLSAGTADALWKRLTDVPTWTEWSPGFKSTAIDGAFEVGSTICSVTYDNTKIQSLILEVNPGRSFTDLTVLGSAQIKVRHEVFDHLDGGSEVRFTMQIDGELSRSEAADLGASLSAQIPEVLQSLASSVPAN